MIAAMCFAIIPMIVYTVFANILTSANGEEEFNRQMTELVENQVQTVQTYVDTVNAQVNAVASLDVIKDAASKSSDQAANVLAMLKESNKDINTAVIVNKSGKVVCGKAPADVEIDLKKLVSCEDNTLYAIDTSTKMMFVKAKVGSSSLVIFYNVAADTFLCKVPANSTFYTEGILRVVVPALNAEYILINASDPGGSFTRFSPDAQQKLSQLGENMSTELTRFDVQENNFTETHAEIMRRVGGANDPVVIAGCAVKYSDVYASSAVSTMIVVLVILAILSIAGAIFVAVSVTRPLNTIEETLIKIHRGDHEARITTVSNNEYGQISRAFNNLVDEIVVSEDRYRTIIEMSDNIIFEWNFKSNEVFFSNNFNKKFSYRAPSDHFADSFLLKAKLHSDDSDRYKSDLEKLGNGDEFKGNEYRMKNIYGDFIWVLMRTATLRDKDGNPSKIVGVMVDIDRAKKSEQQLTARASYDALTSLYNRETIESQINNEITLSEARKSEMAVLFVDVDDFKHYNDQYSHATGDQVLKFVANTVNGIVGEYGFAGRYGGDEFIACIRNAELNDPARAAQEIIAKLNDGFICDSGDQLKISVSIGIAVIKDDYNTQVEYLIGKADDAMYSVKKSGKSNYAFI